MTRPMEEESQSFSWTILGGMRTNSVNQAPGICEQQQSCKTGERSGEEMYSLSRDPIPPTLN